MDIFLHFEEFVLNEANRVYPKNDFIKDAENLGFKHTRTKDGHRFSKNVEGNDISVYCHIHNNEENKYMDPKSIQHMKDALIKEYNITKSMENIKKAPWKKWQLPEPTEEELKNPTHYISDNKEEKERLKKIEWFNRRYNKIQGIDFLCNHSKKADKNVIIAYKEERRKTKFNTFKSVDEKEPLNPDWFDDFWENPNDDRLMCGIGLCNYITDKKTGKTVYEVFPILPNGVVRRKTFIEESNNVPDFKNNINE